ncbi:MAG TPA: hypothetical protein VMX13_07695 [Sedimentisphaerales bacterium]|nr:hypothetical protein [Sedimentisphaerales bacterium]
MGNHKSTRISTKRVSSREKKGTRISLQKDGAQADGQGVEIRGTGDQGGKEENGGIFGLVGGAFAPLVKLTEMRLKARAVREVRKI